MSKHTMTLRPAVEADIPRLEELLYQVHGLHAEGRPDLFIPGCKKYTADQLRGILSDPINTPVFVCEAADCTWRTQKQ